MIAATRRSSFAMLGLAAWLLAGGANAQQRVVPTPDQLRLSYAPVVQRVAPSVVNVYAAKAVQQSRNPLFDDPLFRRFFGGGPGAPGGQMARSLGSGVIVE